MAKKLHLILASITLCGALAAPAQAFDLFGLFGSDDGNSDNIATVKAGVLPQYSDTVRLGPALEQYYDCLDGSSKWTSFTTKKEEQVVRFSCALHDFTHDLSDLGLLETIVAFGSGLGSLFSDHATKDDPFSSSQELTQKALKPQSVTMQQDFVFSLVESGKFSPRDFSLEFSYDDGRKFTQVVGGDMLKLIYADKPLLDLNNEEITKLLFGLPQAYQEAQPTAGAAL
ncbi:MAG: hypothetical protein IAA31_08625 [Candidatus Anaerobiospirillum merdipullorum]|uniref:Uncharacterized protein n=1 Tax=Candidatus Anaerobiospirillum merdipullorum TaxID=2838450 RepID=A0A9E2KPA7_9GAMM|nr:hypothetical protein [Candidatus Anaerobiospirillum merdipullorum]